MNGNFINKNLDCIYGLCFFFMSLYSFYFFGFSILTIFGFFVLVFAGLVSKRRRRLVGFSVFIVFALLYFYSLLGVVFFSLDYDLKRLAGFLLILIILFSLGLLVDVGSIRRPVKFFLVIHVLFFYTQFFSYYMFGVYLNFLEPFGLESRNFGGDFSLPYIDRFMRASGLFSEPGTYACFIAPMVALFNRFIVTKSDFLVFILAVGTLMLTFSTFGLVFFTIIVFFLIQSKFIKFFFVLGFIFFTMPYFYWRFFIRPEIGLDSGLGFRGEYIYAALSNFTSVKGFFWGNGGFSSLGYNFLEAGADNDSGLFFYILYNFGGFPFLMFFLAIFLMLLRSDKVGVVVVSIIFFSKISFLSIAFPLYLFLALVRGGVSESINHCTCGNANLFFNSKINRSTS